MFFTVAKVKNSQQLVLCQKHTKKIKKNDPVNKILKKIVFLQRKTNI